MERKFDYKRTLPIREARAMPPSRSKNGFDALQQVERERPEAVVLDLALPRLSGREVQRELNAHPGTQQIPIIAVSGTDMSDLSSRVSPTPSGNQSVQTH